MDVPAQHWSPSSRLFQPNPKPWEYEDSQNVRLVRENGGISLHGHSYFVSRALIGQHVQINFLDQRAVVYFCKTPVRELDLTTGSSQHLDFGQLRHTRTKALLAAPQPTDSPCDPLRKSFLKRDILEPPSCKGCHETACKGSLET